VKDEWRRFIFGEDSEQSSTPLNFGKLLSNVKPSHSGGNNITQFPTADVYGTAFNATTVVDMGPVPFSEFETEVELQSTEMRPHY
jgi:hypothetical protein